MRIRLAVLSVALSFGTPAAGQTPDLDASTPEGAFFDAAQPALDAADLVADAGVGSPDGTSPPAADVDAADDVTPPIASPVAAPVNIPDAPTAPQVVPSASAPAAAPVEVTVQARKSAADQLQTSSAAVTVVKLGQAKKRSADLGEVLARVPGVSIRRGGSLGSDFRLSLNGLQGPQVRTFLDGVPLFILYAQGLADIPINLLDRIEVYRGVVPIRLGSDALGGVINLVKPERYATAAKVSYQVGSFGTHRASLIGRYRHEPSGFVAGVEGYFDHADNDYKIDVQAADERGRLRPVRVRRFHDVYRDYGVVAEAGVVDKPWAKKLLVRGFYSTYRKQLQHNIVMTVPYGEARYRERAQGALLHYQTELARNTELEAVASYGRRAIDFVDKSRWVYDWFGARITERLQPGEFQTPPVDQTVWQDTGFARLTADVPITDGHALVLNTSPMYVSRTGDQRLQVSPEARDPLTAERRLLSFVSGAEYVSRFFSMRGAPGQGGKRRPEDYRIENSLFVKSYIYRAWSEESLPGNVFKDRFAKRNRFGVGDMLRAYLVDWLLVKLSYEFATRLPSPDELFGDAVLIGPSLDLEPETSHNANFGPRSEIKSPRWGHLIADLNAFMRETDKQIVLLGADRSLAYENVLLARSLGVEGASQWTSPGRWVELQFSMTYQDLRNQSTSGPFASFQGDRLPNRPWLFGSWGAQLRFANLIAQGDELEPFYLGRYTHEFYRGWESVGLRDFKQSVDTMLSHGLGITYGFKVGLGHLDVTLEAQNLTDAKLYDFFGVQRPGRAFYAKIAGDI